MHQARNKLNATEEAKRGTIFAFAFCFLHCLVFHYVFSILCPKGSRSSLVTGILLDFRVADSKFCASLDRHGVTHLMPVLPFYRNQSIDLHSKSIDWFLYGGNTGI